MMVDPLWLSESKVEEQRFSVFSGASEVCLLWKKVTSFITVAQKKNAIE